ncbi:MAG TPA: HdeD family acid-resistance protein [Thermopetrobacter sp.]|nr:HdeD family acid-resistance protein [Thermopetrobacter sp.]
MVQGIATLVLGTIGLYIASLVTLATVYVFGGLMLVGGVFQIGHALLEKDRAWAHRVFNILIGLIYVITSVIVFINPLAASLALTIMVAALFMAVGVIRLYAAWRLHRAGLSWLWLALAGLVNVLFGAFVAFTLPVSQFWVIGILVSVEMIMQGWLMIMVALAARSVAGAREQAAGGK